MITGPAKGMGAAITAAFAAEGAQAGADRPRRRRDRAGRRRRQIANGGAGHRRALRPHRCRGNATRRRKDQGGLRRPHRYSGQCRRRLRPGRQNRRRDDAGGIRRHRHAQHEWLLSHHARGAADHDRAALRQDRQCRRHVRHARTRRTHGLFGLEMGPARHHQELCARSRPVQHQRQLRRARHGRRPALSRQGLRRHGQALGISSKRRPSGTPPNMRSSASPSTTTSPMPACFLPATPRARSPVSICRSMAAGPCCEETHT